SRRAARGSPGAARARAPGRGDRRARASFDGLRAEAKVAAIRVAGADLEVDVRRLARARARREIEARPAGFVAVLHAAEAVLAARREKLDRSAHAVAEEEVAEAGVAVEGRAERHVREAQPERSERGRVRPDAPARPVVLIIDDRHADEQGVTA